MFQAMTAFLHSNVYSDHLDIIIFETLSSIARDNTVQVLRTV